MSSSPYPRIVAWQPLARRYLIEVKKDWSVLADEEAGLRWHERMTDSIAKFGEWLNHPDDEALRGKLLALPLHPKSTEWVPPERR